MLSNDNHFYLHEFNKNTAVVVNIKLPMTKCFDNEKKEKQNKEKRNKAI